jgi:precorrin-6B methylase 2
MVKFERRDPFPYLPDGSFSKSEARAHAVEADLYLGLRIPEIESKLNQQGSKTPAPDASGEHQQLWFGLDPQDLLTPYLEIRTTLENLKLQGKKHVVDLGAAYGRMGFVIERNYPDLLFTGYEYVGERVVEAERALKRFGAKRASVEHADLTSSHFHLPDADVFFIYDYGTPKAIEKTLHDLRKQALKKEILIVARGRSCRYSIETRHRWLSKADALAPERAITVYRSLLSLNRIESPVEHGI